MRLLLGLDDTDSSRGYCTTYLAYRIAVDLAPEVKVLPYPKLVRLNPNIPFKTWGNAAVCLQLEADDPDLAFELLSAKVAELSDVGGGANSGMVLLEDPSSAKLFEGLYLDALSGVVSPHRARLLVREAGARSFELGNGMGIVGAASSLGFGDGSDRTYELIAYRRKESWGKPRTLDGSSVQRMDREMFPHLFNNFDYQKRKVLIAPHGPDPVFAGVRGDSPERVVRAFAMLEHAEPLEGHMVYLSNQHTDAHLQRRLDWKVYSSGWFDGTVEAVRVGVGGHAYLTVIEGGEKRAVAAYEPTGDLTRTARRLRKGDGGRASGGVRWGTSRPPKALNLEKIVVLSAGRGGLPRGVYVSSPRANRHLTKPLIRYGVEDEATELTVDGWLRVGVIQPRVRA